MSDSSDVICRVRGLGKVYDYYADPKGRIREWISLGRRCHHERIVALDDVSFEIERGSSVGLIGHNGAGKSTLLRILGGLTPPTAGKIEISGRCYALTDLAIGFHPEFNGRDNARFNAEILGIPRRDRRKRLEQILEFSELGDALDRPLKTYSSGMMMRLGFSVAIHVEADLLLVDEVLAVGDEHFFFKCIDAMEDYRRRGGTLVYCSHDMKEILRVCERCLWIDHGRLQLDGPAQPTADSYLAHVLALERANAERSAEVGRERNWPRIRRVWMTGLHDDVVRDEFQTGDDVAIKIAYEAPDPNLVFNLGVRVNRYDAMFCFGGSARHEGYEIPFQRVEGGVHVGQATFRVPGLRLLTGEYTISVYLADDRSIVAYHEESDVVRFRVRHDGADTGLFRADVQWQFEHD